MNLKLVVEELYDRLHETDECCEEHRGEEPRRHPQRWFVLELKRAGVEVTRQTVRNWYKSIPSSRRRQLIQITAALRARERCPLCGLWCESWEARSEHLTETHHWEAA